MPFFQHVETAQISPTNCFLCGNHEGPFIDTGVEHQLVGRLYICASTDNRIGCVRQMGRLDGLAEPIANEEITKRIEQGLRDVQPAAVTIFDEKLAVSRAAVEQITELVTELAKNKLVPALEVYELGRKDAARQD